MGYRTTKSKIKVESHKANTYTDFYYHFFRNILVVSLPLLVIFFLVLSISHSSARISSSDNLAISVPSSCTLSSSVDSEHSASIVNGRYEEGIGTTTLSTFCNDKNGYSVYAIGDSLNSEGNNTLVSDINSNYDIPSGTATSGDTSNWAMKLSLKAGDTSTTPPTIISPFTNYSTVPTYWTRVATIPASTTDMEKGSSFTTTYATYISPTQAAGTYLGQVKYLLTHPSTVPPERAYIMQEVADWGDDLPNEGDSVIAFDNRDGKEYWVTRLADGNLWMTSNLDLDIGGTGVAALTSENTDISITASGSGIYANGYTESNGVWTWTPVSTAITSNTTISGTTVSPAWPTNNYTTPYSAEGGDTYYYTSNTTGNDTRYTSLQACKNASHTEEECKRYFAGNYYNWSAAIASNNSTNIGSTVGDIASNSICPKGWRLPNASQTDNINNEFGRMLYQAEITAKVSAGNDSVGYTTGGFNKLRSDPYYFVRSGHIDGGTLGNPGVVGYYLSSTVSSSTSAYRLGFNGIGIYPAHNDSRYYGRSVRCVAR